MNTKTRILSILNASSLDSSVTGVPSFNLSQLNLDDYPDIELPTNLRLGHLTEKIVSELIKSSRNYKVIYENVQIIEHKNTLGEIDFIIKELKTNQVIHLELAYKFYLFDPSISSVAINNWIGPNRNDSLIKKLQKIKNKQFPLLNHKATQSKLNSVNLNYTSQVLCLLTSLFIPYKYEGSFNPIIKKAIKGYYLSFDQFTSLDNTLKSYYLPLKKEWGMEPSENENWTIFNDIKSIIRIFIKERQAPLCWQKHENIYSAFFIIWW